MVHYFQPFQSGCQGMQSWQWNSIMAMISAQKKAGNIHILS